MMSVKLFQLLQNLLSDHDREFSRKTQQLQVTEEICYINCLYLVRFIRLMKMINFISAYAVNTYCSSYIHAYYYYFLEQSQTIRVKASF